MKFKSISKLLIGSMFLFNSNIESYSSTLSADTRYETFKGSTINVNDILEDGSAEIEIEGSTLGNIVENGKYVRLNQLAYENATYYAVDVNLRYPLKANTTYTIAFDITSNPYNHIPLASIILGQGEVEEGYGVDTWSNRLHWDKTFNMIPNNPGIGRYQATFTTSSRIEETSFKWIKIIGEKVGGAPFDTVIENLTIVKGDRNIEGYVDGLKSVGQDNTNEPHLKIISQGPSNRRSEKKVTFTEPLRGTPDSSDRLFKRNGEWVIERKFAEITFDGSADEDWIKTGTGSNSARSTFTCEFVPKPGMKSVQIWNPIEHSDYAIADKFQYSGDELYLTEPKCEGFAQGHMDYANTDRWYIGMLNSRLSSPDPATFRQWLTQNPVTIVYKLATPYYEVLSIDSVAELFTGSTTLSNNSVIPAVMTASVDRVANRAKEAVTLAENSPTIENVSQARFWTNLMNESTLKDSLHNKTDAINDISEIINVEKKDISANIDLYLKMSNVLSLSLDTNSVVFDEVDFTEEVIMPNAINLSVTSSLPYKVKASLESEIFTKDKSEKLDSSTIAIKANASTPYQVFNNLNTPLTLLDDQVSGTNTIHGVDLKLVTNKVPKSDIYKTSIKFEVEQK